jgi:hypothetical protein
MTMQDLDDAAVPQLVTLPKLGCAHPIAVGLHQFLKGRGRQPPIDTLDPHRWCGLSDG